MLNHNLLRQRRSIVKHGLFACLLAATSLIIIGCARPAINTDSGGANVLGRSNQVSGSSTTGVDQDADGIRINWDAPLPGGILTTPSKAAEVGLLGFTPRVPRLTIQPTAVEVSNPAATALADRAIAFIYHFPVGADFPNDGRVRILEYQTTLSQTDLEQVAANPPGPPENFKVVIVAGHKALLVQANEIGRVQFIENGLMIDVFGPAIPVPQVMKIAAEL